MKERIMALLSVLCLMFLGFGACGKNEAINTFPTAEPTATVVPDDTGIWENNAATKKEKEVMYKRCT